MKFRNLLLVVLAVTGILFWTHAGADETAKGILVSNAWVQAMPPSQKSTAAFMSIENTTDQEMILESASSDIAGATEIHQMSHKDGMMHMGPAGDIPVPARGNVVLEHGGFHIMLINLKKPANKGDVVAITLHFRGGYDVPVKADVREE